MVMIRSHDARLYVLVNAVVMVMELMIIRSSGAGVMERRDSVYVQHEVFSVTHRSGVTGIPGQSYCKWTQTTGQKKTSASGFSHVYSLQHQ